MNGKAGLTVLRNLKPVGSLTYRKGATSTSRTRQLNGLRVGDRYNFQILTRRFTGSGRNDACYLRFRYKDPVIDTSPFI